MLLCENSIFARNKRSERGRGKTGAAPPRAILSHSRRLVGWRGNSFHSIRCCLTCAVASSCGVIAWLDLLTADRVRQDGRLGVAATQCKGCQRQVRGLPLWGQRAKAGRRQPWRPARGAAQSASWLAAVEGDGRLPAGFGRRARERERLGHGLRSEVTPYAASTGRARTTRTGLSCLALSRPSLKRETADQDIHSDRKRDWLPGELSSRNGLGEVSVSLPCSPGQPR